MPQMSPMEWLLLLFNFTMAFLIFLPLIFFIKKSNLSLSSSTLKIPMKNWKW